MPATLYRLCALSKQREVMVQLPTLESLLGDKLTAFAPTTIGVPLRKPDGTPGEVFADASYRVQPLVHGTLSDACVGISISLQHGITPDDLAKSLGTVPFWELVGGEMVMVDAPASPIGTIIAEIRRAADHG